MANEEMIMKLNMLEEQGNERKAQIEQVSEQINEMEGLKSSLKKINGKDKEMLANLGRGVFLKTKIDDDKVFVNVGKKILVRKTVPEALEIIENQIRGLGKMKSQLEMSIGEINAQLYGLLEEAQKIDNQ